MEIYSNWEFATKYNISHSWSHKDKECRIEIKVWLTSIPQSSGFFRFSVFKDDNIIMGSPPLPQPYLGYLIIPVYGICKSLYFFKEIITWMWMKWQYGKWPLQMSGPCTLTSSHVFLFGYFVQNVQDSFSTNFSNEKGILSVVCSRNVRIWAIRTLSAYCYSTPALLPGSYLLSSKNQMCGVRSWDRKVGFWRARWDDLFYGPFI